MTDVEAATSTCWNCGRHSAPDHRRCPDCGELLVEGSGRYVVRSRLGRPGGFGTAYRVFDQQLGRECALKIPNSAERRHVESVRRELERLQEIDHPAIVRVRDGDPEGGWFVMPVFDGNLDDLIATRRDEVTGAFLDLAIPLTEGLVAAHRQNVIHRDIKPANILFREEPDGSLRLALADFGIAKLISKSPADTVIGTAKYMALEIFLGTPYDERVDVYSLGVTFYEMLYGPWPVNFVGAGLAALTQLEDLRSTISFDSDRVSPELAALIERMTIPSAEYRVRSALQVLSELRALQGPVGSFSIDDLQARVARIYAQQNVSIDHIQAIARATARATAIANLVKYSLGDDLRTLVKTHLLWLLSWLFTTATAYNLSIASCIWSKYPSRCPYCARASCGCGGYSLDEKRDLLRVIYEQGHELRQAAPRHPLEYYVEMFRGVYGAKNKTRPIQELAYQLQTEVCEIQSLALRRDVLRVADTNLLIAQELADAIAWHFALCDQLDIPIVTEFSEFFASGCPRCGESQCGCETSDLDLVGDEWDALSAEFSASISEDKS